MHAQPHLRADQPAYISSCHTHTQAHSQIGYRRRRFSDLNRSGKLSAFSIESRFPHGDLVLEVGRRVRCVCRQPTFPHMVVSARVHLHKAWSLGQREVVSFQSTSPLHSQRRFGLMKNGLHIRLTSYSWCAAKWVWPQLARSLRWH